MDAYDSIKKLWISFQIDSMSALDQYLGNFRILFAYHSGKIENDEITYHDTREIFENGKVINFTGNPRSIMEQQNQKLCYEFLKPRIVARESLTVELVREVHRILTAGTFDEIRFVLKGERPGEFKMHDYVTGIHEVGSQPGQVEGDLAELLAEVNGYEGQNYLKTAAYFHLRFEYIHPFADGNGRVGRTLLNHYLMTHGEPPVIVFDGDKDRYYRALEQYDSVETIEPMADFLREETVKTWGETLERSFGRLEPVKKKLNEYLDGQG